MPGWAADPRSFLEQGNPCLFVVVTDNAAVQNRCRFSERLTGTESPGKPFVVSRRIGHDEAITLIAGLQEQFPDTGFGKIPVEIRQSPALQLLL